MADSSTDPDADRAGEKPGAEERRSNRVPWIITGTVAAVALLAAAGVVGYGIGQNGTDGTPNSAVPSPPANSRTPTPTGDQNPAGQVLSSSPSNATRAFYHDLATSRSSEACSRMTVKAAAAFAADEGFSTCLAAVAGLAPQVVNLNDYVESMPSTSAQDLSAVDTITIDSCDYDITGGPALGVFTLTKVEVGQWLITGHSPGPATCPAR